MIINSHSLAPEGGQGSNPGKRQRQRKPSKPQPPINPQNAPQKVIPPLMPYKDPSEPICPRIRKKAPPERGKKWDPRRRKRHFSQEPCLPHGLHCWSCDGTYLNRESIIAHFRSTHGFRSVDLNTHFPRGLPEMGFKNGVEGRYACFHCGEIFNEFTPRSIHIETEHAVFLGPTLDTRAECVHCERFFTGWKEVLEHSLHEHGDVLNVRFTPLDFEARDPALANVRAEAAAAAAAKASAQK